MREFDDALRFERERRAPVRQAVEKSWPLISEARRQGEPLDAIFRALRRMGEPVGKGPSSFRAAVKYLDAHRGAAGEPSSVNPTNTPLPATVTEDRGRFADTRFTSDF